MFTQPLPVADLLTGQMVRPRGLVDGPSPKGTFAFDHVRGGLVIGRYTVPNGITNAAKNSLLDAWFNNGGRSTSWWVGLVDASGFGTFSPADIPSGHAGWTEFTGFTVSGNSLLRAAWGQGAASAQAVTNPSPLIYDFTAGGSVQGIFVITDGTKHGTIGLLWSTAAFLTALPVLIGDQLRVTYTVQL